MEGVGDGKTYHRNIMSKLWVFVHVRVAGGLLVLGQHLSRI